MLAAPFAGAIDTGVSLARGDGPWATPAARSDTDAITALGGQAAGAFDPDLLFETSPADVTSWARRLLPETAEESAPLKPYGQFGGHHVPAKSAFRGAPGYNPRTALAIPLDELDRLDVSHRAITNAQNALYRAQGGQPLTWDQVQSIETEALVRGGMDHKVAAATVRKAVGAMKADGIAGPNRIPWGK
jgi:hypothetical protein